MKQKFNVLLYVQEVLTHLKYIVRFYIKWVRTDNTWKEKQTKNIINFLPYLWIMSPKIMYWIYSAIIILYTYVYNFSWKYVNCLYIVNSNADPDM